MNATQTTTSRKTYTIEIGTTHASANSSRQAWQIAKEAGAVWPRMQGIADRIFCYAADDVTLVATIVVHEA